MTKIIFSSLADLSYKNSNLLTFQSSNIIKVLKSEINLVRDFEKEFLLKNYDLEKQKFYKFFPFGKKSIIFIREILKLICFFNCEPETLTRRLIREKIKKFLIKLEKIKNENYIYIPEVYSFYFRDYRFKNVVGSGFFLYTEPTNVEMVNRLKHEIIKWGFNLKEFLPYFKNLREYYLNIKDSNFIISISDYSSEKIRRYYSKDIRKKLIEVSFIPTKSTTIIEKNYPEKFSKQRPLRLLTIAHFNLFKGLQYLLRAYEDIKRNKDIHIELVIVGTLDNKIKKLINKNFPWFYTDKNIKFIGFRKDLTDFYKNSDVFILPSLTESFPRVFAEAFSHSLPAIATPVFPYLNNKYGLNIPFQDYKSIEETLINIYNEPEILKKFNENIVKTLKKGNPFGLRSFLKRNKKLRKEIENKINN